MSVQIIENQTFDQERALYGSHDLTVRRCAFSGPADGESAFKECSRIAAEECFFNLRYPLWHVHGLTVRHSEMTELCRAALWYSDHIAIEDTRLHGIKALRECDHAQLRHYLPRIWLVFPGREAFRLRRQERIFLPPWGGPAL